MDDNDEVSWIDPPKLPLVESLKDGESVIGIYHISIWNRDELLKEVKNRFTSALAMDDLSFETDDGPITMIQVSFKKDSEFPLENFKKNVVEDSGWRFILPTEEPDNYIGLRFRSPCHAMVIDFFIRHSSPSLADRYSENARPTDDWMLESFLTVTGEKYVQTSHPVQDIR